MRVILFGGTGMVGQGVLRECLRDARVEEVLAIGRVTVGRTDPKLREHITPDPSDLAPLRAELGRFDACFFCLGVSSVGLREDEYRRITYELTMRVARTLAEVAPQLVFIFVSGSGTDASSGRMWARIKGETENALFALPLRAYAFRPAYIHPVDGVRSRTRLYNALIPLFVPLYPLLKAMMPGYVTTSALLGKAMIAVAHEGAPTRVLASREIAAAAGHTA